MAKVAMRGGKVILRGSRVALANTPAEACACCCDPTICGTLTLRYVDENRCEDDVFDVYVYNPTTLAERYVAELDMQSSPPGCCGTDDDGNLCPQTTIDIPLLLLPEDVDDNCEFGIELRFKRANAHGTLARFFVFSDVGNQVSSRTFTPAGIPKGDSGGIFSIQEVCASASPSEV